MYVCGGEGEAQVRQESLEGGGGYPDLQGEESMVQ